jgi:uncharacterized lipoprotein YajG
MRAKTAKCLLILATATIISGCATPAHVPFDPPKRPTFYQYDVITWGLMPLIVQDAIRADDLACKKYITTTEQLAIRHNEAR